MNDMQLQKQLKSVGRACFVRYFQQFSDNYRNILSNENLINLLMRQEGYTEAGSKIRVNFAQRIFSSNRAVDALQDVAKSARISKELAAEAARLAETLQHDLSIRHSATIAINPMLNTITVAGLEAECHTLFEQLSELQHKIHKKLSAHADEKNLKGNELVGWLGEIYGKLLLNGTLVSDREEHDFVTDAGWHVSVKSRKGWKSGWKKTSAIPKIEGNICPTHLLFVHLNDDYSIDRMWLLEWGEILRSGRFKKHIVRGSLRSYFFAIDEEKDKSKVIYGNPHYNVSSSKSKPKALSAPILDQ